MNSKRRPRRGLHDAAPNHAATMCYGIFNLPGQSSDDACEDDVFVNRDRL